MTSDSSSTPPLGVLFGIAATFFALGITVNVVVLERIESETRTFVAAVVINAATTELAYLAVRDAGGGVLAALIAGWVVASRFGLLAASLGSRITVGRAHRLAIALQSFDPNVGLAVQHGSQHNVIRTFWRVTAAMHAGWWSGTIVGIVFGNVIGDAGTWGLDAIFPAAMLAIIGNLLRERAGMVAAVIGATVCVGLLGVAPAGVPIILSVSGAVVALGIRSEENQ